MHYYSYRFISLLGTLLYVQVTRDSSQWELSLYTHYQGSTTGHSTRAFHHHQSVFSGVQRREAPQPSVTLPSQHGRRYRPGQGSPSSQWGCGRAPVYCCASGSHLRAPTPQQRMLSMVPSLPSPTQRAPGILELSSKLWLCLLWPQHHGTNTHNTAALNSAWLH